MHPLFTIVSNVLLSFSGGVIATFLTWKWLEMRQAQKAYKEALSNNASWLSKANAQKTIAIRQFRIALFVWIFCLILCFFLSLLANRL